MCYNLPVKNGVAAKQYVGILACIFPFILKK